VLNHIFALLSWTNSRIRDSNSPKRSFEPDPARSIIAGGFGTASFGEPAAIEVDV